MDWWIAAAVVGVGAALGLFAALAATVGRPAVAADTWRIAVSHSVGRASTATNSAETMRLRSSPPEKTMIVGIDLMPKVRASSRSRSTKPPSPSIECRK